MIQDKSSLEKLFQQSDEHLDRHRMPSVSYHVFISILLESALRYGASESTIFSAGSPLQKFLPSLKQTVTSTTKQIVEDGFVFKDPQKVNFLLIYYPK